MVLCGILERSKSVWVLSVIPFAVPFSSKKEANFDTLKKDFPDISSPSMTHNNHLPAAHYKLRSFLLQLHTGFYANKRKRKCLLSIRQLRSCPYFVIKLVAHSSTHPSSACNKLLLQTLCAKPGDDSVAVTGTGRSNSYINN